MTAINCAIFQATLPINMEELYIISTTSVTISHATLSTNRASTLQGGAIYSMSELTCECCVFLNNSAADGGAVIVNDNSSFTSCEFYDNTA